MCAVLHSKCPAGYLPYTWSACVIIFLFRGGGCVVGRLVRDYHSLSIVPCLRQPLTTHPRDPFKTESGGSLLGGGVGTGLCAKLWSLSFPVFFSCLSCVSPRRRASLLVNPLLHRLTDIFRMCFFSFFDFLSPCFSDVVHLCVEGASVPVDSLWPAEALLLNLWQLQQHAVSELRR